VLEIESPDPDAHDHVQTYEITNLRTRTHQFKSVKSVIQVGPCIWYLAAILCGLLESNDCTITSV